MVHDKPLLDEVLKIAEKGLRGVVIKHVDPRDAQVPARTVCVNEDEALFNHLLAARVPAEHVGIECCSGQACMR